MRIVLFIVALGLCGWLPNQIKAQAVEAPQFKYDPFWPKPLPEGWVLGSVGSVCVDARDHVFAVTRGRTRTQGEEPGNVRAAGYRV